MRGIHTHTHSLPKGGKIESREEPPEAIVRHVALDESLAASMLDELDAELSGLGAVNTDGDELSRAGQPTSTSLSSWLTAPEAPLVYLILLFLGTLACAIYLRTAYPREHPDIEFTILFKTSFICSA